MLESRPEDALGSLAEIFEIVETVDTNFTVKYVIVFLHYSLFPFEHQYHLRGWNCVNIKTILGGGAAFEKSNSW